MATAIRVKVLRPLVGDDGKGGTKRYEPGEYRTLAPADADRLAATGAVAVVGAPGRARATSAEPRAKAAPRPQNKRAPKPANKSA